MCGRFGLDVESHELEQNFDASFYSDEERNQYQPNHDIRPSLNVPVILSEDARYISLAHWGFKGKIFNPKTKNLTDQMFINARGETLNEKRNFKTSWNNGQRCIFIMNRFYEWMATSTGKIPVAIELKSKFPFAVAGIYKHQKIQDHERLVACLITTKGNQLLTLVHNQGTNQHRMPAMLLEDERQHWLEAGLLPNEAQSLIKPYPDDALQAYPVNKQLTEPMAVDFKERTDLENAANEHGFDFVAG